MATALETPGSFEGKKEKCTQTTPVLGLKQRVLELEKEFEEMLLTAEELTGVVKKYVDKVETERQSWDILENLMESGCTGRDILDHVKIFFNFLLAKMESYHAAITDIKMLWHLYDTVGTKDAFHRALKSFGFCADDEKHIRLLLGMVYKRQIDLEQKTGSDVTRVSKHCESMSKNFEDCLEALSVKHSNKKNNGESEDDTNHAQRKTFEEINDKTDEFSGETAMHHLKNSDFFDKPVTDIDSKLARTLGKWQVDDNLKEVAKRIMGIVIYSLNVGRADKNLSIVVPAK